MINVSVNKLVAFRLRQRRVASGKIRKFTWTYVNSKRINHERLNDRTVIVPIYKYWFKITCPIGNGREMVAYKSWITEAYDVRVAADELFESFREGYDRH